MKNNISDVCNLIDNQDIKIMDKLKNLYIFVVESSKNKEDLIWLSEPFHILEDSETYLDDNNEKITQYDVNIVGHVIKNNKENTFWTDKALDHNIEYLFSVNHLIPLRTVRQKAIVEANDMNFVLSKFRKSNGDIYNKFETWSVYELFKYMYHLTDQQKQL